MIIRRKIDFFGGTHGHYLELVINHAIDGNSYDISNNQFNANGACHVKSKDESYKPITRAGHWSYDNIPFNDNDLVIRIQVESDHFLIAMINSFLRAGDQTLDLVDLHNQTYEKMSNLPKLKFFLKMLSDNHGQAESYSRQVLRHYFYSMFAVPEYGVDTFNQWAPACYVHNFKFSSFFSLEKFYVELQRIAQFVNLEFTPSTQMVELHRQFIEKNQGWQSYEKCSKIIQSIIEQQTVDLNLNIVEEAWLDWRISQIFNIYDLECLKQDSTPSTTSTIIKEINKHYNKGSKC
jgi:hypothetical protein